ncbi:hypothetical protein TREMEDRAFT_25795 [Tremella mesenterica DSM 1558]|nr:uncharacterized protein TREMEDRAFT_25795 [Tremella mesenterica DSM 1558]EIW73247.1 hypothetical protein TREMEDRAFT_25795 [Tremella mesenterica DSM 1558]
MASPAIPDFLPSPETSYTRGNRSISQDVSDEQWQQLANVVRDVGPMLNPDVELGDIAAAEAAVRVKDNEQAQVVDQLRTDLKALSRQYNAAQQAAQRPSSAPSAAEHDAQVRTLEQQQYATVKQLNEEQASVAKKETELSKWKAEKETVGNIKIGEDDWVDGKIIRLKLFSDAGFSLLPSKENGGASKVLIRNDVKSDVHSVSIDKNRSRVFNANMIWSLASE